MLLPAARLPSLLPAAAAGTAHAACCGCVCCCCCSCGRRSFGCGSCSHCSGCGGIPGCCCCPAAAPSTPLSSCCCCCCWYTNCQGCQLLRSHFAASYASNCRINPMLGDTQGLTALRCSRAAARLRLQCDIRYPSTTVALRDTPAAQCTSTEPEGCCSRTQNTTHVAGQGTARHSTAYTAHNGHQEQAAW